MPGRKNVSLRLALLALAALTTRVPQQIAVATEEPKYTVVSSDENFEVRSYEPYIVAETIVSSADLESGSDEGFRRLAGYIFGGNRVRESIPMTAPVTTARSEKIAMTAPVETHAAGSDLVMTFMMPSGYTIETLPEPTDPRITLRKVPSRHVAAVRFSGSWSEERFREHTDLLLKWVEAKGFKAMGTPTVARYDAPWTPWFMRRNEILVEVAWPRGSGGNGL